MIELDFSLILPSLRRELYAAVNQKPLEYWPSGSEETIELW